MSINPRMSEHWNHLHIGNLPPVDEEWSRRYEERRQAARMRKGEVLAALAAVTDPVLRAVIDHHRRQGEDDPFDRRRCNGCDQGCSCDTAAWPCSTIVAICEALGVDMTDMDGDMDMADWGAEL